MGCTPRSRPERRGRLPRDSARAAKVRGRWRQGAGAQNRFHQSHDMDPIWGVRPDLGRSVEDAYRVTPLVRQRYEAGGAKALGRKIGFTNRTIWTQYGVYAPI